MTSNDSLSGSVFTIEVDRLPVLTFSTKLYSHAEELRSDPRIREKLKAVRSGGKPLCDDRAIMRVRLALTDEKQRYFDESAKLGGEKSLIIVYLVPLDEAPGANFIGLPRAQDPI